MTTTMTAGRWDVSREAYHADRTAVCHSALMDFRRSVPMYHARHVAGTLEREATDAMELGTAFHALCLEPSVYESEFYSSGVDRPDRRTKDGKALHAWHEDQAAGRQIVWKDEAALLIDMAASVSAHSYTGTLLTLPGEFERALRWQDDVTGLWCRCLPDKLIETPDGQALILDLKTTTDPTPESFSRSVVKFGYHTQAAWYTWGVRQALGLQADFLVVAVGKTPPHEVCAYTLEAESLAAAERTNRAALDELADRTSRGDWRSRWSEIQTLTLPAWATS